MRFLTSNCTTNLVRHWEKIAGEDLPLDRRWILAGYADEFTFDLGLIETEADFEETCRRNLIGEKALACGGAEDFSLCIRG